MTVREAISGTIAFLIVSAIVMALLYFTPLSYVYCLVRQNAWLSAKTETELDRRMFPFFTKRSISPSDSSDFAREYVLKPDERMVRYLVFQKEPFDVVFDAQSRVVRAFTTYE